MTTPLDALLLGLVTNALSTFVLALGRHVGPFLVGKELKRRLAQKNTSLQPLLTKAATEFAEEVVWKGPGRFEEVCLFLTSPEAEAVLRKIFSSKLIESNNKATLTSIEHSFVSSMSLFIGVDAKSLKSSSRSLFAALVEAAEISLEQAIEEGVLAAHEAKSAARSLAIQSDISALREQVSVLTSINAPTLKCFLAFEAKYRKQVGARHGQITPPHYDSA